MAGQRRTGIRPSPRPSVGGMRSVAHPIRRDPRVGHSRKSGYCFAGMARGQSGSFMRIRTPRATIPEIALNGIPSYACRNAFSAPARSPVPSRFQPIKQGRRRRSTPAGRRSGPSSPPPPTPRMAGWADSPTAAPAARGGRAFSAGMPRWEEVPAAARVAYLVTPNGWAAKASGHPRPFHCSLQMCLRCPWSRAEDSRSAGIHAFAARVVLDENSWCGRAAKAWPPRDHASINSAIFQCHRLFSTNHVDIYATQPA